MTIRVTVRYFAGHRDITGRSSEQFELEDGATVATLWDTLVAAYPNMAPYAGRVLYAVNEEFSNLQQVLCDHDDVAFIPPVSGGLPRRRLDRNTL